MPNFENDFYGNENERELYRRRLEEGIDRIIKTSLRPAVAIAEKEIVQAGFGTIDEAHKEMHAYWGNIKEGDRGYVAMAVIGQLLIDGNIGEVVALIENVGFPEGPDNMDAICSKDDIILLLAMEVELGKIEDDNKK